MTCPDCGGSGTYIDTKPCSRCGGIGSIPDPEPEEE